MKNIYLFLFVVFFIQPIQAQFIIEETNIWTGGGDGFSWEDANNWSLAQAPLDNHRAVINDGSDVTITGSTTISDLILVDGSVTMPDLFFVQDSILIEQNGFLYLDMNTEASTIVNNGIIDWLVNSPASLKADRFVTDNGFWSSLDQVSLESLTTGTAASFKGQFGFSPSNNFIFPSQILVESGDTLTFDSGGMISFNQSCSAGFCSPLSILGAGTVINFDQLQIDTGLSIDGDITFENRNTIDLSNYSNGGDSGVGGIDINNGSFLNTSAGTIRMIDESTYIFDGVGSAFTNQGTIHVQSTNTGVGNLIDGFVHEGNLIIDANSRLNFSGDISIAASGTISGTGEIFLNQAPALSNFSFSGVFSPGNSPGTLTIGGNNTLTTNSGTRYLVEIDGPNSGEFDVLQLNVDANLDIVVELVLGYEPSLGDQYQIIQTTGTLTDNIPSTVSATFNGSSYDFTVTRTSDGIILEALGSPLPVKLSSFTATKEQQSVRLVWVTESESNNDYFSIERSANGIEFEEIGRIEGHGTIQETTEYSFVDQAPLPFNYYRLKQVDYDNSLDYSSVLSIQFQQNHSIYPSPVRVGETVNISGKVNSFVIYSLEGKILYNESFDSPQSNCYINTSMLSRGVYFIQVNGSETHKLVVQ